MRRICPNNFLVNLMLQRLTRTRTGTVRDRYRMISTAVTLLLRTGMHGTVMRRTMMLRQRRLVRLLPFSAVFVRLPHFPPRRQRTSRAVTVRADHRRASFYRGFSDDVLPRSRRLVRRRYGVRLRHRTVGVTE